MTRITTLTTTDTLDKLVELDVEANSLTLLGPDSLNGLSGLQQLNLAYNNLSVLPNGLFDKLLELRVLRLDNNRLKTIPENAFVNNLKLEELRLSHNPLLHFLPNYIRPTTELRRLDLAGCGLYSLPVEAFTFARHLEQLELSSNRFDKVPTLSLLTISSSLKRLTLSHNPIIVLDENSFKGLVAIERLELCEMPHLVDILPYTFAQQLELRELKINDNPHLYYIDRLAFSSSGRRNVTRVPKLEHLELSHNG